LQPERRSSTRERGARDAAVAQVVTQRIRGHLAELKKLDGRDRKRYLQSLMGEASRDKNELHFRALLMTALNEEGVWPPR
jgi:hypothetical protein